MTALSLNFAEVSVHREYTRIMRDKLVYSVYQPIISLRDGSVFGYEALARGPAGSVLESPEALIRHAQAMRNLIDVEYMFRYAALKSAQNLPPHAKIFINVNPNIIQDETFREGFTAACLRAFQIVPERVYFEITERESIFNIPAFRSIMEHYKSQNYKIGIDDVGAGYSGLNLIADVQPHFIKLDMQLVRHIDTDRTKQAIVKSMCEFAARTDAFVVGEGVETQEELQKLIELGVDYAQGFFIQTPAVHPRPVNAAVRYAIVQQNARKNRCSGTSVGDCCIKYSSTPSATVADSTRAATVVSMLESQAALPGVSVVRGGYAVGILTRSTLSRWREGAPQGLWADTPVEAVMDTDFLHVDCGTALDTVVRKAMLRPADTCYDFVVVTREGRYFGVVTIKALLETIAAL